MLENLKKELKKVSTLVEVRDNNEKEFYSIVEPILRDYLKNNIHYSYSEIAEKLNVTKGAINNWLNYKLPKERVGDLIKLATEGRS